MSGKKLTEMALTSHYIDAQGDGSFACDPTYHTAMKVRAGKSGEMVEVQDAGECIFLEGAAHVCETGDRAIANLRRREILPDVGGRSLFNPRSVETHPPEHAGRADTALAPMPIEAYATRILPAGSRIMP